MKAWCPHRVRWFRWCADCAGPDDFVDVQELVDAVCMSVWRDRGSVGFLITPPMLKAQAQDFIRPEQMNEVQCDLLRHGDE